VLSEPPLSTQEEIGQGQPLLAAVAKNAFGGSNGLVPSEKYVRDTALLV
jgi:hypothetical protein